MKREFLGDEETQDTSAETLYEDQLTDLANTRQHKRTQNITKQHKTTQNNTRQYKTIQDNTKHYTTLQDTTKHYKTIEWANEFAKFGR